MEFEWKILNDEKNINITVCYTTAGACIN